MSCTKILHLYSHCSVHFGKIRLSTIETVMKKLCFVICNFKKLNDRAIIEYWTPVAFHCELFCYILKCTIFLRTRNMFLCFNLWPKICEQTWCYFINVLVYHMLKCILINHWASLFIVQSKWFFSMILLNSIIIFIFK